jgi:hypothetical protein
MFRACADGDIKIEKYRIEINQKASKTLLAFFNYTLRYYFRLAGLPAFFAPFFADFLAAFLAGLPAFLAPFFAADFLAAPFFAGLPAFFAPAFFATFFAIMFFLG